MVAITEELEKLVKWFKKEVDRNLKLHSCLLITRRPDPEKRLKEKTFTAPLKIFRCSDFLEVCVHASKHILPQIPLTLEMFAAKINDLTKVEDAVNLMQILLTNSNEQFIRVYPDPQTYLNKMQSKEATKKPRAVILAPK